MIAETHKTIHIRYYAVLREQRGVGDENFKTKARTPRELFDELNQKYRFGLPLLSLRVSVNDCFQSWDAELNDQDQIVFIPPVAGG